MAALRQATSNRATVIFVIALLIVVHLLVVHGHDEPSALEACLVLWVSATAALVAGSLLRTREARRLTPVAAPEGGEPREVRPPSWTLVGTVMRH